MSKPRPFSIRRNDCSRYRALAYLLLIPRRPSQILAIRETAPIIHPEYLIQSSVLRLAISRNLFFWFFCNRSSYCISRPTSEHNLPIPPYRRAWAVRISWVAPGSCISATARESMGEAHDTCSTGRQPCAATDGAHGRPMGCMCGRRSESAAHPEAAIEPEATSPLRPGKVTKRGLLRVPVSIYRSRNRSWRIRSPPSSSYRPLLVDRYQHQTMGIAP